MVESISMYIYSHIHRLLQLTPFYLHAPIIIIFMEIEIERATPTYARARIIPIHFESSCFILHLYSIHSVQTLEWFIYCTAHHHACPFFLLYVGLLFIFRWNEVKSPSIERKKPLFFRDPQPHTYVRTYSTSWDAMNEFILSDK